MPANRKAEYPPLYHLYNVWISLTRHLTEFYKTTEDEPGRLIPDILILSVIYRGTIDKIPMTASLIATESGIPRVTVLRRLALIERQRLVKRRGKTWSMSATFMRRQLPKDSDKIVKMIKNTFKRLPKK